MNLNTAINNYTRSIQKTADSSDTIAIHELNITYHSKFGALQESLHIFIQNGLMYYIDKNHFNKNETLNIFEVGLGTGLNAILSLGEAINLNQKIYYQTIEAFPLSGDEVKQLNYNSFINQNIQTKFFELHNCNWNKPFGIHELFCFEKIDKTLQQFSTNKKFHLIYFDAFDPNTQPELWTKDVFIKLNDMLLQNGILLTYCSKSIVRKALLEAGFSVEKLKGPPHKREIIRARKLNA